MIPTLPFILIQSVVFRVLLSLGVSFVTYYSFNGLMGYVSGTLKGYIFSGMAGNGMYASLQLMGLFGVDKGINLLLSAYSARIAMASMKRFKMGG